MKLIPDEDSNKSVSITYWDTTDDYFSESDDDSLPNLLIRGVVDSDGDDSSIESMGDDLSNKSNNDFPTKRGFLAQEKEQVVIKDNPEKVILDNGMNISIFDDACLAKNTQKEKDNLMMYANAGKILLIPIDLCIVVDGKNDDGSDDSVYVPPLDKESDFYGEDCPSEEENDGEDDFVDSERIVEELDQILVDPTDRNQLTSEEDDCCVKDVSILEAEYIEKVKEFNSRPTPPKYNYKTGKLYTTVIKGVEEKRIKSTGEFIRDANMYRGLVNAVLDPSEENQGHD